MSQALATLPSLSLKGQFATSRVGGNRSTWAPHEEATLIRMWDEGGTLDQIVEALAPMRSRSAVENRRIVLGLPSRDNRKGAEGMTARQRADAATKARAAREGVTLIDRVCLECRSPFVATSRFIRSCTPCKVAHYDDSYCTPEEAHAHVH